MYKSLILDENDNIYAFHIFNENIKKDSIVLAENIYLRLKRCNVNTNGELSINERNGNIIWSCNICNLDTLPKYRFDIDFYEVDKNGVLLGLSEIGKSMVDLGCYKIIVPHFVNGIMVKELGESCFEGSRIQEIVLPDSLIKIGRKSFAFSEIGAIKIPNSCVEISEYAFMECYDLEYIDFGNGVNKIGLCAFCECRCLNETGIFIPNSVKEIGENAFDGLENVDFIVDNSPNSISVICDNTVDMTEFDDYCYEDDDDEEDDEEDDEDDEDDDDLYYQEYFFGAYNVNVKYLR